ncbi:hypothetical protein GCM10009617_36430 [Leifsonia poae]|uniref:Uncharacterized protein n=1 Tax=Leifsonia poae TaxID=110933 RepID=A0A9W6HAL3_9MICO|nr:hypothetical protein GCM10017584_21220 [Leifsonia poae]
MGLDVRIDALVNEGHAGGVADEEKRRPVDDSGVHGDVPFYSQAEPELRLRSKGAAISLDTADADAVH